MDELTLEQLNLELAVAHLADCQSYLQECLDRLEKAQRNIRELKEYEQERDTKIT